MASRSDLCNKIPHLSFARFVHVLENINMSLKKANFKVFLCLSCLLIFILYKILFLSYSSTQFKYTIPNKTHKTDINSYNYNLMNEPNKILCSNIKQPRSSTQRRLLFFIFIVTSPNQNTLRQTIRRTWANYSSQIYNFKLVFTIGLSKKNKTNEMIKLENEIHQDILQANIYDSYNIITIKDMITLKWINTHCSNTHFIVKMADDVMANIHELVSYFQSKLNYKNTIFGRIALDQGPTRDPKYWQSYVTMEEFNGNLYEPFPSGTAFVITNDLSESLYQYALGFWAPPFSDRLDDVYIGMIAASLKTKFVDIRQSFVPENHYLNISALEKIQLIKRNGVEKTFFVHAKEEQLEELWSFFYRND